MKKKKKLHLEAIKVKSYVTSLENDEKNKVKGGWMFPTEPPICTLGITNACGI